jgi:hypothetical protein
MAGENGVTLVPGNSMSDRRKKPEGVNGPELMQVFKRGVQFTEELIQENERLRFRLVQLEGENRQLARQAMVPTSYAELLDKVRMAEEEKTSLLERFNAIEIENHDFKQRFAEIEEENNRLANLYVASFALHSTLDLKGVVQHCFDILVNLVGTRDFALYISEKSKLMPVRSEGRPLGSLAPMVVGRGVAGRAARDRLLFLSADDVTRASVQKPKACVPLVIGDSLLGMFVIFSFLQQKDCVTELDRELFKLLGGHAATAMYSAWMNAAQGGVRRRVKSFRQLVAT